MKKTWFKPFYSDDWHIEKKGEHTSNSLCGGWLAVPSAPREERPDDAPDNCAACLRLAEKGGRHDHRREVSAM